MSVFTGRGFCDQPCECLAMAIIVWMSPCDRDDASRSWELVVAFYYFVRTLVGAIGRSPVSISICDRTSVSWIVVTVGTLSAMMVTSMGPVGKFNRVVDG